MKKFAFIAIFFALVFGTAFGFWVSAGSDAGPPGRMIDRIKSRFLSGQDSAGEPVNILLIGSDSRRGETARSDTLILMHVDFSNRRVYLVSIPRDTRVYIPGRGQDKINAAYAYGQSELAVETVEDLLDIDMHYSAEVDFEGFKDVVDTVGGIDITVKKAINDRSSQYRMQIPAGRQRMDGETALNYVRYRHGDSDIERTRRQQNFLRSLAAGTITPRSVLRLPKLIEIFNDNVSTDMSKRDMLSLIGFLREVPKSNLETITISGESSNIGGISYIEPDRVFIAELLDRIEDGRSVKSMKSKDESDKMSITD